jgi:glutamate/tyrosine decarboxylase-like PLP-dependent enzyme
VIGGAVPAALAADWLTSTWDQNAGLYVAGPAAAIVEEIAGAWLADLLRIPRATSFAFVTGTQMAHATAMAAARNHVLAEVGWGRGGEGLERRSSDPRVCL